LSAEIYNTVEFIWIMSKFNASTCKNIEQLIRTPTMRALLSANQPRINELLEAFEESPEAKLRISILLL
jgi:CRISPR/Cas system-associated endonuclease/helicase Cas3